MKTKGISFFEQHVEKIVLGVSGVVFVSVLVWQLFPTTVKVDGKNVALGDLDREISTKTEMLKRKLDTENTPLSEQLKGKLPPTIDGSAYSAMAAARTLSPDALPQIEPRLARAIQSSGGVGSDTYYVPVLAAAKMGSTLQFDDTVDATFIQQNPKAKELPAFVGASLDVSWLVPSATLDAKALFAEFAKFTQEAKAIPPSWYRNNLFLVDVVFERQEVLPDGTNGATSQVEVLPAAFTLRDKIVQNPDATLRDAVWESLSDTSTQRAVLQPEFIPTKRGNFSAASMLNDPSEAAEGEDPKLRSLRKNVAKQSLEVSRLEEDLKALGGPLEDTSKEDKKREDEEKNESGSGNRGGSGNSGQNRPGGGLGGGGLSGGMGGGKNTGGADPRDEATKEKRIKMTKTLREKKARLASLQKELEKLGASVEASKAVGPFDPKSQDRLVVWAHDLGVLPGKTYRYRVALRPYNPFFTYAGLLDKEQKSLAGPFTMDTPVSTWSDPVTVAPRIAFFVTDAVPGEGRLGIGQVSVEIYTYQDGERRVERVTLQPGDLIAAKEDDAETGYYLVDVVADPTAERGGADRRASAIAIIQAENGKLYEVKVPSTEVRSDRRLNLQDEVELAKAEAEQRSANDDGDSKAGEGTQAPPPRGPSGG
jgi:uncharacterized membrane protein YgcG